MTSAQVLTQWIKAMYHGNTIKRTRLPYFTHLLAVAEMAAPLTHYGYEVGLCHDLLEDIDITADEFYDKLVSFGFDNDAATNITGQVVELTDVFTKSAYPKMSKSIRKEKEAARLLTLGAGAQTVKYADLIDNTNWVVKHDKKRALEYLTKKQKLITELRLGDEGLRREALGLIKGELERF